MNKRCENISPQLILTYFNLPSRAKKTNSPRNPIARSDEYIFLSTNHCQNYQKKHIRTTRQLQMHWKKKLSSFNVSNRMKFKSSLVPTWLKFQPLSIVLFPWINNRTTNFSQPILFPEIAVERQLESLNITQHFEEVELDPYSN